MALSAGAIMLLAGGAAGVAYVAYKSGAFGGSTASGGDAAGGGGYADGGASVDPGVAAAINDLYAGQDSIMQALGQLGVPGAANSALGTGDAAPTLSLLSPEREQNLLDFFKDQATQDARKNAEAIDQQTASFISEQQKQTAAIEDAESLSKISDYANLGLVGAIGAGMAWKGGKKAYNFFSARSAVADVGASLPESASVAGEFKAFDPVRSGTMSEFEAARITRPLSSPVNARYSQEATEVFERSRAAKAATETLSTEARAVEGAKAESFFARFGRAGSIAKAEEGGSLLARIAGAGKAAAPALRVAGKVAAVAGPVAEVVAAGVESYNLSNEYLKTHRNETVGDKAVGAGAVAAGTVANVGGFLLSQRVGYDARGRAQVTSGIPVISPIAKIFGQNWYTTKTF